MICNNSVRLIFYSIILISYNVQATDSLDGFYNKLSSVFSSEKCQIPTSLSSNPKDCESKSAGGSHQQSMQNVSESVFYNRLAELEKDRLQCASDEWSSYSSQGESGKANQEFMVAKINSILPDLQFLKNEISKLVGETQLLRGRLPGNFQNRQLEPQYEKLKKEFEEKNELAKKLMAAYELRISEISHSENPIIREFIEDHLSSFSKKHTDVKPDEFEKIVKKMRESFQNTITEIDKTKKNGQYDLSIKQQAKYSSDPTLIAILTKENPDASQTISTMQCTAKSRLQTKELVELGGTIATTLLPIGAIAVAKAARAAVVLRSPQMAKGFEVGARGLGWAAVIGGGLQTTNAVYNACYSDTKAEVAGACKQSPQTLIERHERGTCIWEAVLASAPGISKLGSGFLLQRMADKTTPLAQFVEKMSGRRNLRAQDLGFSGSLKDEDRILAARGILGRDLSKTQEEALIRAHNVGGLKGYGQYTDAEIAQKREILRSAGFSERETETMLWKGIAGFNKTEIADLAKKRASEFFEKPISDSQARAIVEDTDLMLARKPMEERLKKLIDAGFTRQQAQEIVDQKLHKVGSVSATVASRNASSARPAVAPSAPSRTTASAPLTSKPTGISTPATTDSATTVIQAESAAVKKYTGSSNLYDLSNNPKATPREIEAAITPELKRNGYKPSEHASYIIDTFNNDVEHLYKLKGKLDAAKVGTTERTNLEQSIKAYQARCRSWKALYIKANYTNTNVISNFTTQIQRVCTD